MRYYVLGLLYVILLSCRDKATQVRPVEVYPSGIYLKGISGTSVNLSWQVYGGYSCGWECFPDENDYKHIVPDYYEIYTGNSKSSLSRYKIISGKSTDLNEIFPQNQSLYIQLKAIYSAGAKEAVSNVIMVSSDKIPQSQRLDTQYNGFTMDNQGEKFVSVWVIRPTVLNDSKAILVGKNNNNEYGTWFQDKINNKQVWLWKNITSAAWSPDKRKVLLSKLIDKKTESVNELYIFDSESFQLEPIPFKGKSVSGFSWSPDSKSVVFCSSDSLSNYKIHKKELGVADIATLLETNNNTAAFHAGTQAIEGFYSLKWKAADEIIVQKSLTYIKGNQALGEQQIYSLNTNNKTLIRASVFEDSDWTEWSLASNDNGSKIAFVSRRSGYAALWIKDVLKNRMYQLSNQACLSCNLSFNEWITNDELVYSTLNSNSDELIFYKVKLD